jgi:hypothetical protein
VPSFPDIGAQSHLSKAAGISMDGQQWESYPAANEYDGHGVAWAVVHVVLQTGQYNLAVMNS